MNTPKAKEYADYDTLGDMLQQAEVNASSDWEIQFVTDMQTKFELYGDDMYMTDRQWNVLSRLAGGSK